MEVNPDKIQNSKHQWGLIGAVISAIAASICCLGPLVLLTLGISGAWIGNLSALEPYRPLFMVVTLGFLGFAFYKVYGKSRKACSTGSACAHPKSGRLSKVILWTVTVLVLGLFAVPYALPYLSANKKGSYVGGTDEKTNTVTLDIQNMTCAGCVATVTGTLEGMEGVLDAQVTIDPPQAVVVYNPDRINMETMSAITAKVGYPSYPHQKRGE